MCINIKQYKIYTITLCVTPSRILNGSQTAEEVMIKQKINIETGWKIQIAWSEQEGLRELK